MDAFQSLPTYSDTSFSEQSGLGILLDIGYGSWSESDSHYYGKNVPIDGHATFAFGYYVYNSRGGHGYCYAGSSIGVNSTPIFILHETYYYISLGDYTSFNYALIFGWPNV